MSSELAVNYLGLELSTPVIIGACPLTIEPETVRQLVDAGAGALVLPSMLQEQIVHNMIKASDPLGAISKSGYQPQMDRYNSGIENYLWPIGSMKSHCDVPIIASMNGASEGSGLDYAKEIESAGADALELNFQTAAFDPDTTSEATQAKLCHIVAGVVDCVSIPVAVKISK